mmetsp:Transcript_825/g.1886  ORF Transcript_825/g.1886 Transcript_825/m.1886 type:complete len:396 (+) Transcript_825:47-1234(+)
MMAIPFCSRSLQLRPPIIQVRVLPLVVLYFCASLTIPIVVHGWTQTRIWTKQSEVRVPLPLSSFITNGETNANDVVTMKSASKSRSTPTLSYSKSHNTNNEEDGIQQSIPTCVIAFALGVAAFLLLPVPSSYAATSTTATSTTTVEGYGSYNCPQFFASQTLGIQNVLREPTVRSPPSASAAASRSSKTGSTAKTVVSPQTTTSTALWSSSSYSYCPTSRDEANEYGSDGEDNYSVRGLIYLPSNNEKDKNSKEEYSSSSLSSSLVVTVRSSENPSSSILLMGAKIPMEQIESFPISFALSSKSPNNNFLMKDRDWEQSILDASNELYVTAKICSSSSSSSSECKSPVFQGSGISRKLLVPNNKFGADEDDFRTVRGAASIRLSETSTPDTLYTW